MPTYGYVCEKCGHEFERIQSIAAAALKICPKDLCGQKRWGKGAVKRSISVGGGLIFKGSGFYTTDYRSDSYKEAAKKDSTAPSSASTSSTPSESKPSGGDTKPAAAPAKPAAKKKAA
jgi:putative FmdB family regulatory protein